MIDVKELMIDNYLEWKGMIFKVSGIQNYGDSYKVDFEFNPNYSDHHPENIHINDINPIPLTEDWLMEFGFVKYVDHYKFIINGKRVIQVNNIQGNPHLWLKDEHTTIYEEYVFLSHPKYIHQLQNSYFILTGEELKLKS